MEILFKEKQPVYFLNIPEEQKIENIITKGNKPNFDSCFLAGNISEIHIKDNKLWYDIISYDHYGNEILVEKYVPEEFIKTSKEELKEIFKNSYIDVLTTLINLYKKI